ncbi:MAG: excinuclease ABC subunit UvrA [Deltaproteobacteria bacterium]|nr:excinuclease ABC subunit UvrA [Deltaproteobacteria bacterium]
MKSIIIKGAREHNLKNFDIEIPKQKLVVITGVSGSGKSSLAFDTIYAEGQRRYVESLSVYARQFLEQMDKPDVESIEGLSPAIAIEQKTTSRNPRSTVGTITEIYDYLRLLYARVGSLYCHKCGKPINFQTITQMTERAMALEPGSRVLILSPVVRGRKGEYKKELDGFRRMGYTRARIDGAVVELDKVVSLDKRKKHFIDVIVDRLVIGGAVRGRLAEALESSTRLSGGFAAIEYADAPKGKKGLFFNERLSCADCGVSYPEITPAMFSFNSPHGACPECNGLGEKFFFDEELAVPDKNLSVNQAALLPWRKKGAASNAAWFEQIIPSLCRHYRFDADIPFAKLTKKVKDALLHGSGEEKIKVEYKKGKSSYTFHEPFEGLIANLERRYKETESEEARAELERFMNAQSCHVCLGSRLKAEALCVKVGDRTIRESVCATVADAFAFFSSLKLDETKAAIARRILKEITERLSFLVNVGLGYLSLERAAATLSGGEAQRIRLATQIGSSLTGVLYVLDEPSIGLHQRDNRRLIAALKRLRDMGNTVIVVEHDESTIESADFIIDMGPGAGELGGEVVASGSVKDILGSKRSMTAKYLDGELSIEVPKTRKRADGRMITLSGMKANNLKDITVSIPVGLMTCVTGVSGSGKSTFVIDTLERQLMRRLYGSKERAGALDSISGLEHVDKVIGIDQTPIGRTPRSNPATYTGVFMPIRELYSRLPEAKLKGYGPGRFSFNVKGGRCEACAGDGVIKVEMHFLPDVYVHCEECAKKRYNRETLEVRYKGKNIAECLEMTVLEAAKFFENVPQVKEKLDTLAEVGLGYIRLGQSATTLSGGEAQRIKLSKELSKRATGKTLYILDEPTTGLHFADIKMLISVLMRLRDAGNTIIIIEHNLDVIKSADYVIDLGPEGGEAGGRLMAEGTPEEIAKVKGSYTGEFLKEALSAKSIAMRAHPG